MGLFSGKGTEEELIEAAEQAVEEKERHGELNYQPMFHKRRWVGSREEEDKK